jgi:16S rRNA (cytidine1402-2'-O)-methyltransferase
MENEVEEMWIQKSFENEEIKGILYLVPTPIGNLEDMSVRALRILKESDWIAAEDTRNTKKLCHYFEIETPLISYHEHNKLVSGLKIIDRLKEGAKIALVSDAGMPTISDPGYELVMSAIEQEISVVPLPGANAALTALIASGLPTQPFYFYGFLDRQKKTKKKELEKLASMDSTIILYESPHRLKETLELIESVLGNRRLVLCRELTKKYEEFIRGTVEELQQWANEGEIRGEFCLIIEGALDLDVSAHDNLWWKDLSAKEHVEHYIVANGLSSKEAIKLAAKDRGVHKSEVYQAFHIEK